MPLSDLFEGLFGASFRGVEFHMLDSRDATGRRWLKFLFPGRDDAAWEDLGALDGPISVSGILLGDDYVEQAEALRAACRQAGPGTLVHPWLGEIEVVLPEPAVFEYSDRSLRLCRFDATFERWRTAQAPALDTLGQLLEGARQLRATIRSTLRTVLAPVRLALGVVAAVQGFATSAISTVSGLVSGVQGSSGLLAVLAAPFGGLSTIGAQTLDADYGGRVADAFDAVPAAVATAALPAPAPAIAPAGPAPAIVQVDPAQAATLLLAVAAAAPALTPDAPIAVSAGFQAQCAVAAAEAAARIAFGSRPEAEDWRARVDAGLGAAAASAASAAATDPAMGEVWRALQSCRAAWAADIGERIGRLPALASIETAGTVPVLLIANAIAGDDAGAILATAEDLVRRNRIARPGAVPPGRYWHLAR